MRINLKMFKSYPFKYGVIALIYATYIITKIEKIERTNCIKKN